mgnify:CR=1 FL=1
MRTNVQNGQMFGQIFRQMSQTEQMSGQMSLTERMFGQCPKLDKYPDKCSKLDKCSKQFVQKLPKAFVQLETPVPNYPGHLAGTFV